MELNCPVCNDPVVGLRRVYCSETCKRTSDVRRRREIRYSVETPELAGPLVRLADVPYHIRLAAYRRLLRDRELTPDEALLVVAAVVAPGDISTRVA